MADQDSVSDLVISNTLSSYVGGVRSIGTECDEVGRCNQAWKEKIKVITVVKRLKELGSLWVGSAAGLKFNRRNAANSLWKKK